MESGARASPRTSASIRHSRDCETFALIIHYAAVAMRGLMFIFKVVFWLWAVLLVLLLVLGPL